jgi:hypothetical protein
VEAAAFKKKRLARHSSKNRDPCSTNQQVPVYYSGDAVPDRYLMLKNLVRRAQRAAMVALDPPRMKQNSLLRAGHTASFEERVAYDAFTRPAYAYGISRAAHQAKHLGIPRISVAEFGVAGGNGLVAMEEIAAEVSQAVGVGIEVYGFDHGVGLPPPTDYRDLPYAWQVGQFHMDESALRSRLKYAKLVLGDVRQTLEPFLERNDLAPIGFVSFDLDYYSSTVSALGLFNGPPNRLLPRVYSYFDDTIGPDNELHCKFVGELLAIEEFNVNHNDRKLALIHGLRHKRIIPASWNDAMYVLHVFSHPEYPAYIPTGVDMGLALLP